jgi:hypothetical protein
MVGLYFAWRTVKIAENERRLADRKMRREHLDRVHQLVGIARSSVSTVLAGGFSSETWDGMARSLQVELLGLEEDLPLCAAASRAAAAKELLTACEAAEPEIWAMIGRIARDDARAAEAGRRRWLRTERRRQPQPQRQWLDVLQGSREVT